MKRRERKRARADSTAPAATAKSRAGNPGKGQGKKSRPRCGSVFPARFYRPDTKYYLEQTKVRPVLPGR